MLLVLDKKNNININLAIESSKFKEVIQNNLQILRTKIKKVGLKLEDLNIFSLENKNESKSTYYETDKLDFGLDIKA